MTPDIIFKLSNGLAMIGWIILILLPRYRSDKLVIGIFVTLLAIVYAYLVFDEFKPRDLEGFGSLQGVSVLFQRPKILLAGWVHYLAFDLMVGLWTKNNGFKQGVNHWYLAPCLVFTFLLGPLGLLFYLIIRIFVSKKYFSKNF
ncbi:MAG TPA: ABA4-like family protein [Chryseolinea sp.]|nr:ABA4-like family protein [Chryseolinea sp.]